MSSPETPHRRADRALLFFGAVLMVFLALQLLDFAYGRDQGIYALAGQTLLRGEVPYLHVWDFKTPGIFVVYGASQALFGADPLGIRLFELGAIAAMILAFVVLSRRFMGGSGPGLLGGVVAAMGWIEFGFWNTAQPESFGACVLAWALVCATSERRPLAMGVVAGALYGFAALLKPPLGGGVLVSIGIAMFAKGTRDDTSGPRSPWASLAAYSIGFGLLLLALVGWFALEGALDALRDTLLVWTPEYTRLSTEFSKLPTNLGLALIKWLFGFSTFNVVGLLALFVLPRVTPLERGAALHVLGVVGFTVFGAALQGKFFDYHFASAIPLTGLLAGWGYWKIWIRLRNSRRGILAAAALALLVVVGALPPTTRGNLSMWRKHSDRVRAWLQPERAQAIRDDLYSMPNSKSETNRFAAEWLVANTNAEDTVFIWGFEPAIYVLADRRPASRYVYNVPQRVAWGDPARHRRLLLDELEANAPKAVIVQEGDVFDWVVGHGRDSRDELELFPEFVAHLAEHFEPAIRFGQLELYLRIK